MSTSPILRRALCAGLALLAGQAPRVRAAPGPTPATAPAPARPNILLILVDDMGFSDLGCYGSEVPTPNLDRLAAGGVRFTQFYNTARCSTSRAALLTGLYPHQAGMGHLDSHRRPDSQGTHGRLHDRCVTLAEVLGPAGYHTSIVGKWHLGQQNGTPPWERGFQRTASTQFGELYFPRERSPEACKYVYLDGRKTPADSPELGTNTWYSTFLFTDHALKFIDDAQAQAKPFFLYFAHGAAHFPLKAPADVIAKYRSRYKKDGWDTLRAERHRRQIAAGLVDPAWPLSPRPADVPAWDSLTPQEQDRFDSIMAVYAAMIDCIDQSVGRLTAGLRERGLLDNTLILFLHDNGGNAESGPDGIADGDPPGGPDSRVLLGMNWATLANTPFRRYKHFTHEGGISTPLIAHWPAGIPAARNGALEHQPGHLIDILPTAAEVGRAPYPSEFKGRAILPAEGVSLVPAFAGKPLNRARPIFWEHEGNKAVRSGPWKAVQKHKEPWELYNIDDDRTEQRNLAQAQPDRLRDLSARWDAWAAASFVDIWEGNLHNEWGDIRRRDSDTPFLRHKPFTVTVSADAGTAPRGVLIAQGGQAFGYALYFDGSHTPVLAFRNSSKLATLSAGAPASGRVEISASVTADTLSLTVNGATVTQKNPFGLLTSQPIDGQSIGFDSDASVGDYPAPNRFTGTVIQHSVKTAH
jgi:arylsulfatase